MTLEAKFETGAVDPPYDAGQLPWGYGDDRIVALVRSPESLYVYWEITDEAIARASSRLGAAGKHGWCNLRVYDTTARDFDGTNANGYFDVGVDRGTREWFFSLPHPTATFHVEIGIKTHEGFFQAIARSGRAELPRKEPSSNHTLEWQTVTSADVHPASQPYRSKFAARPGAPPAPPTNVQAAASTPTAGPARNAGSPLRDGHTAHLEGYGEGFEVLGTWEVAIRGFEREQGRRLTSWRMHWVRVEQTVVERWWATFESVHASEWLGASERGLGGASGVMFGGASGFLVGGASEGALGVGSGSSPFGSSFRSSGSSPTGWR